MNIITKDEFMLNKNYYLNLIDEGAVFIYPTDTIYGIGCNANDKQAVQKIRILKNRPNSPFSVIVPSVDWIHENCLLTSEIKDWLAKLPGPYTFVMDLKNDLTLAPNVNPESDSVGIRIPDHWFVHEMEGYENPIITTSANKSGMDFMVSLDTLNKEIGENVDFIIYEGENHGRPSKIVDFRFEDINVRER